MSAAVHALLAVFVILPGPLAFAEVRDESPLVDAGLDQTVSAGTTVYLDGTGSRDPDGRITAYGWVIRGPDGEQFSPHCETCKTTRFTPKEPGRYAVTLEATGSAGATGTDTLYVTVEAGATPPAVSQRGPDVALRGPRTPETGDVSVYTATLRAGDAPLETVEWYVRGKLVTTAPARGQTATLTRTVTSPTRHTLTVRAVDEAGLNATASMHVTPRVQPSPEKETGERRNAGRKKTRSGGSSNRHPSVEIRAPEFVDPGAVATVRADARDADGYIAGYEWNTGDENASLEHAFPDAPGRDVDFSVVVRDNLGLTASDTATVHLRPTVSITGPDCIRPDTTHTFTAHVQADGDEIRRYGWENAAPSGPRGKTAVYRLDGPTNTSVPIGVTVEDEDGATARTTTHVPVCGIELSADDAPPAVEYLQGRVLEETNGQQRTYDVDVFQDPVTVRHKSSVTLVFSARATDPDGGILTYEWEVRDKPGDGGSGGAAKMKRESGAVARFPHHFTFSSNGPTSARLPTRTLSLTVTDENGTSVSTTRQIKFRQGAGFRGSENTWLTVDKERPATGELVTISIHTVDSIPMQNGNKRGFRLHYGDGEWERLEVHKRDGEWETARLTHAYDTVGPHTIQVVPTGSEKITEWGGRKTIHVQAGRTYTEYHWTELLGWSDPIIAAEQPTSESVKRGVHDRTVEVWNETRTLRPVDGKLLGDDWTYEREITRQVPAYEYTTAPAAPGSEWTLVVPNVRKERVIDHWRTVIFETQEEAAGFGLSYDGTVTKWVVEQKYQRSTESPGWAWRRIDGTGEFRQVGWRHVWVDSKRYANPQWKSTGQSRRDNLVTRTVGHNHDPTPHCHDTHLHTYGSAFVDHCHEWHNHGHDHDVREESYWDYEYQYKYPVKKQVYLWSKEVKVQKQVYRYKAPVKKTVWVNRYRKETSKEQAFHVYRKQFREETVEYVWAEPITEEEATVWKPDLRRTVGKITFHEHRCGEKEGHRQDSVCPSLQD